MKTILCSLMAALAFVSPASADRIHGQFTWTGEAGYSMKAKFMLQTSARDVDITYGQEDDGSTQLGMQKLRYWVYDPSGELIASGSNAENGVFSYYYLDFHFDLKDEEFHPGSEFSIGDDPGIYIFGLFGKNGGPDYFHLIAEGDGDPEELDRMGTYTISVPEGGSSAALLTVGVLGVMSLRRPRHVNPHL